jgi:transcriptional regulator with XRE-family HTH domain
MALGHNIRHHRERQKLTLEQLSERSAVDVGTISALENRDSKRSQYASAIARGLNMSMEQLELSIDPTADDSHHLNQVVVSPAVSRLIDRLTALDAAGNWTPALQRALDALLDLAAPRDAARGPEALSGVIASMAADPGSQTPESIAALKQAMGQVAKKRTATKDEDHAQGRGKAKGGRH